MRLFLVFLLFFSIGSYAEDHNDTMRPVRLYSNEFLIPELEMSCARRTIDTIRKAIAPRKLITTTVSLDEIDSVMSEKKADVVIVGSAVYWRHLNDGMRDIATLVTREQPDADHAVGSLILARSDDNRISTLADLKGMVLGINHTIGFQGFLTILKDLADQGYDPENFFRATIPYGLNPQRRFEALRNEEVDAIAINVCYAERQLEKGNDVLKGFKTVGERIPNETRCKATTSLYPNWSFLISPALDAQTIVKIAQALYSMPPGEDGQYWTIASDYRAADDLYKTLKMGSYSYLRLWTAERIWKEFGILIVLSIFTILFLIVHVFRIRRLVNLRTRELSNALIEQKRLSRSYNDVFARLEKTRKTIVVSQLSSMVAHELTQPLASISFYARAQKVLLESGDIVSKKDWLLKAAESILKQTELTSKIINQVRSYASNKDEVFQPIELQSLIIKTVESFITSGRISSDSLKLDFPKEAVIVVGSPLELELSFANIIKNSLEAPNDKKLRLEISLGAEDGKKAVILFSDNTNPVSDADFNKILEPLNSQKTEGLGLGLSIVRTIVDKHFGKVSIKKNADRGLTVRISLPHETSSKKEEDLK